MGAQAGGVPHNSVGLPAIPNRLQETRSFTALLHHLTVNLLRDSFEATSCARSGWHDMGRV